MHRELLYPMFFLMATPLARHETRIRALGVHRERFQGPFGDAEKHTLQELAPYLVQAEEDEHEGRLQTLVSGAESEAFHTQDKAVVLVDRDLRVLRCSQLADQLLRRCSHLFVLRRNHLTTSSSAAPDELGAHVRAVASSGTGRSVVLRSEGMPEVSIEMRRVTSPADPANNPHARVVALYLTEAPALDGLGDVDKAIVRALVTSDKPSKCVAIDIGFELRAFEQRVTRIARKLGIRVPRGTPIRDILRRLFEGRS